MSRNLRLCLESASLLGIFLLISASALADPPTPTIQWTVDLRAAATGWVTVEGTVPRNALPEDGTLELVFRDISGEHGGRLEDLVAAVPDYEPVRVQTEATARGLTGTLTLPADASALLLRYRIDPTYFPPGSTRDNPADARSRLTADLGVLRTTALWPVGDLAGAHGEVRFKLPDGWDVAWPWAVTGGRYHLPEKALRDGEYVVAGPLEKQFLKLNGSRCHLALAAGAEGITLDQIAGLLHLYRTLMGGSPRPIGSNYLVAVVPPEFMHGGAAGRFTAVQSPLAHTLAHELFHWWNSSDYTDDARWFGEGFTEYVAVEAAAATNLMTRDDANAVFADLQEEMLYLEREGRRSLVEYSRASRTDGKANRMLYAKGALLAHALSARLSARGERLTDFVSHVIFDTRKPVDSRAIQAVARERYGDALDADFERYVFGAEPLPRSDFGAATGRSGAARFLPPELTR